MKIKITKCHGSGNDFALVDAITDKIHFQENEYVELTQQVCDRKGKIGADGMLFLLPSENADVKMRIFNADGGEPEMCGNGIRCIARKAYEILDKEVFTVETMKTVLICRKEEDIFRGVISFSVFIDNVSFVSEDFPFVKEEPFINKKLIGLSESYSCSAISLGNPHLVVKKSEVIEDELEKIGLLANSNKILFPRGVNVSFFKKIKPEAIYVQTFERGVGITYSCGTAMSASSIVSCILTDCALNTWIDVYNKGGMVKCYIEKNKDSISAKLLGNATFIYTGIVEFGNGILTDFIQEQTHTSEISNYENLTISCDKYLAK